MGRKLGQIEEDKKEVANQNDEYTAEKDGERALFSFSVDNEEYWKKRVEKLKKEKEFWDKEREEEERKEKERKRKRIETFELVAATLLAIFLIAGIAVRVYNNKNGGAHMTNDLEFWVLSAAFSGTGAIYMLLSGKKKKKEKNH